MGLAFRRPAFTEEQLQLYQDCTYFSRKEILRLYRRFCSLGGGEIDRRAGDVSTRLSFVFLQDMPEMRQNPFKVSSPFYLLFFLSIHFFENCSRRLNYHTGATVRGLLYGRRRSEL